MRSIPPGLGLGPSPGAALGGGRDAFGESEPRSGYALCIPPLGGGAVIHTCPEFLHSPPFARAIFSSESSSFSFTRARYIEDQ